VAWHTPLDYTSNSPVAWVAGTQDPQTCEYENERVWTSGCSPGVHASAQVHRLDGEDGAILDTVEVPGFPCLSSATYGGAADAQGNFWITNTGSPGLLAKIAASHIDTSNISAARFDPMTETWDVADNETAHGWTGIGQDQTGNVWVMCPPCDTALRYDQQQGQFESYAGLDFPYSYSDMTSWALQNAACDPEG
jgi:hypothetical protein